MHPALCLTADTDVLDWVLVQGVPAGLRAQSLKALIAATRHSQSQASSSPARTATASPRGGGGGRPKVWPKAKSLYIRFGRFCLEKPLPSE